MKSKKILADEFIKLHIEQFGLNGTNTRKNPPVGFPSFTDSSDFKLKNPDSVKFGYNGQVFNWRESSTCMFWVDYGNYPSPPDLFINELAHSLEAISRKQKSFSIPFFGTSFSQILQESLAKTDLNYVISLPACSDCEELNFEAEFNRVNDGSQVEKIIFRKEEFETFLRQMAEDVRCVDPIIGFSAFIGSRSKHLHIYYSAWPQIRDENFDTVAGYAVGPANWSVVDNESDFAIARYLMKTKSDGVFNLFYAYPKLIASILNEPSFRKWLKESSLPQSRQPISQLYPSSSRIAANEYLEKLRAELLAKYPKANEAWLTPLNRLVEKMGIQYDFEYHQNEDIYGVVL